MYSHKGGFIIHLAGGQRRKKGEGEIRGGGVINSFAARPMPLFCICSNGGGGGAAVGVERFSLTLVRDTRRLRRRQGGEEETRR